MNYKELDKPLYHGSGVKFSEVDLSISAPNKDFGRGFYTTNDYEQAVKFARLKAKRAGLDCGFVSAFAFSAQGAPTIKLFETANEAWFDFILRNRGFGRYAPPGENAVPDIVIGPVANDAVGVVLNQFVAGAFGNPDEAESKATAIRLLLAQKLHNQVFFGTALAIASLVFKGFDDVRLDG